MDRRFIEVKYRPSDVRSYTFHYEGDETINPGDEVKVADNRDPDPTAWKRVTVAGFRDHAPPFATKPILGLAPPIEGPAA